MIFDPMGESDSSGDEGGLVTRGERERLNMPRATVGMTRDQIEADREFTQKILEADREFAQKILEAERVGIPMPIEVPSDAEYAQRLQDELNNPSQLAGEQDGKAAAREGEVDEPATSSEDEEWEINTNDEAVLTEEEIAVIREKYGIPSFVGMEANPLGYGQSHPPKGSLGMFPSVLAVGFWVRLDNYEREILDTLWLAPI